MILGAIFLKNKRAFFQLFSTGTNPKNTSTWIFFLISSHF